VGLAVGLPLALAFWRCLLDPFARVDPLVRELWLNHVGEAEPGLRYFAFHLKMIQALALPALIGMVGAGLAIAFERGLIRARFALALAMSLMGCLATGFMIRAVFALIPVSLMGSAWIATRLLGFLSARGFGAAGANTSGVLASVALSVTFWASMPTLLGNGKDAPDDKQQCGAAAAYAPLAGLTPGLVLAPIDTGAYLLALTPHTVLTAPYHRANHGNRLAMDILLASPDEAHSLLNAASVAYVVDCPGQGDWNRLAARAPEGLAARLAKGEAPDWLRPVEIMDSPFKIYIISP